MAPPGFIHDMTEPRGFITNPLKAIRANCIDCCGGHPGLVRECQLVGCPLWPFRMGRSPFHAKASEKLRIAALTPSQISQPFDR
jgi:hypothetical protein